MNYELERIAARVNQGRKKRAPFAEGDWVWMLRPKTGVGGNLETWWVGPCKVIARKGVSSYEVLVKPGVFQEVHMDQLKPYVEDQISGKPMALFEFGGGYRPEGIPTGEGWIENVAGHRVTDGGEIEFLIHWRGTPKSDDAWEPGYALWDDAGSVLEEYCQTHGVAAPSPREA